MHNFIKRNIQGNYQLPKPIHSLTTVPFFNSKAHFEMRGEFNASLKPKKKKKKKKKKGKGQDK